MTVFILFVHPDALLWVMCCWITSNCCTVCESFSRLLNAKQTLKAAWLRLNHEMSSRGLWRYEEKGRTLTYDYAVGYVCTVNLKIASAGSWMLQWTNSSSSRRRRKAEVSVYLNAAYVLHSVISWELWCLKTLDIFMPVLGKYQRGEDVRLQIAAGLWTCSGCHGGKCFFAADPPDTYQIRKSCVLNRRSSFFTNLHCKPKGIWHFVPSFKSLQRFLLSCSGLIRFWQQGV